MGKHLLDETAEFRLPRLGRHAAFDEDDVEATQPFDPGFRGSAPVAGQPLESAAR